MGVMVRVPTPLRRLTNNQDKVEVEASTIAEFIDGMERPTPASRNDSWTNQASCAISSTSTSTAKTSGSCREWTPPPSPATR